ncbi:hypothetical protein P4S63_09235 [Pseudoalteromonas sp. B193]
MANEMRADPILFKQYILAQQMRLQNNPQTIERLRKKAVKIELNHYLTQLD